MQHIFAFNDLAVVVRHWYEIGETDEEHGARVELRELVRHDHRGTASAAQPVELDRIFWRADIFDVIDGRPGNQERAHFHCSFEGGIEPVDREWDHELSAEPFTWLAHQLEQVAYLARDTDVRNLDAEAADLQRAIPEIVQTARSLTGETCSDVASCLARTRDTREVVERMSHEMRPQQPGDPRVSRTADH